MDQEAKCPECGSNWYFAIGDYNTFVKCIQRDFQCNKCDCKFTIEFAPSKVYKIKEY